ncbi:GFA family protein [Halopseudomonas pachastrellae]|uniref:GFA family protein n=1 Tax=Halopseudomonas pachastrellae TaxID=254161 RepID=UPI003D7E1B64
MTHAKPLEGRCLCGAVSVSAILSHRDLGACHCTTCRRWGGGPLLAVECEDQVTFSGEAQIGVYASSDWAERGFCKVCGTHLFYRLREQAFYALPVGLFDEQQGWDLNREVFIDQKPSYYGFAQPTLQLTGEELFALHGAS